MRAEQGAVSTAILSPEVANEATRARLQAFHRNSAVSLDVVFLDLEKLKLPQDTSGVAEVREYRRRYDVLFAEVMSAIRRPAAERPANLHAIWGLAINGIILSANFQVGIISASIPDIDSYVTAMLKASAIAWDIRTTVGVDRRLLATIIGSSRPISADDRLQLTQFMANIDPPWEILQRDSALPKTPTKLKAAIKSAQKAYFADTLKIRQRLINQLEQGRPPSLSASQLMTAAEPGLASITYISMTALELAKEHVAQQASIARRSFDISIAFMLLSITVAALILVYIRARVIKPLQLITRTMQTVTQGNLECAIPMQDRQDEMGQFARTLCVFRDGALERQRLVTELARNESARETAEASSRIKSEFLANMSHELRTPLNAILGFSEVIVTESFGPGVPRYRDYATDIHGAGKHLLALINDILDISKAEAGKLELHAEPVDLVELVKECARLMRGRAAKQDLRMSLALTPLPLLLIDRLRTKQVLLNLLSNAIKFTPEGGAITISVSRDETARVVICVRDSGIGITQDLIPTVFEPFRQIDSTLARKFEGTGLGLALVKAFVELHGGTVRIESACGEGTSVYVTFPKECCLAVMQAQSA